MCWSRMRWLVVRWLKVTSRAIEGLRRVDCQAEVPINEQRTAARLTRGVDRGAALIPPWCAVMMDGSWREVAERLERLIRWPVRMPSSVREISARRMRSIDDLTREHW